MLVKLLLLLSLQLVLISNSKIVLEYWTPFTGGDARPMQFIVDKFNNSQDKIIVNMKVINWAEYYSTFAQAIKNKNSPDIVVIHGSKLTELIANEQLVDITSIAKQIQLSWDEFSSNTIDAVRVNNSYYAIPIDTHLLVTFYNKKHLKTTALLDENDNLTIASSEEDVINFFLKLKDNLPQNIKALGEPIDNILPFWIWFSLYNQIEGGGSYIQENKATFNNQAALKVLEFLVTLRDKKIYSEYLNDAQAYNMFKYNKSAVMFTGGWSTWSFNQSKELDFDVAPFIQVYDKKATWSDSHTLAIPKNTPEQNQLAAITFAYFVANEGLVWSSAGHIPSKIQILNSKEYAKQSKQLNYSKNLDFAVSMPKHKKLWQCNTKMTEILTTMMQTKKSAKETLQLAEQEINKILQSDL